MIRSRLRMFGGTTNHWDGRCSPLDAIDFETRAWVPHSGWPITRAQLDPYYARARVLCELGAPVDDDRVLARFGIPDPGLDPSKLRPHVWMLSPPTRFGQKYEPALAQSKNVKVLLHANVVNLQTNAAASHLQHVDVTTLAGKRARIRAKQVVVCCGGIENARLLAAVGLRRARRPRQSPRSRRALLPGARAQLAAGGSDAHPLRAR